MSQSKLNYQSSCINKISKRYTLMLLFQDNFNVLHHEYIMLCFESDGE